MTTDDNTEFTSNLRCCSRCLQWKQPWEFHKDASRKDGLNPACKTCKCKQATQYYEAHRERVLKQAQQRRAENKDAIREQRKRNYDKHHAHHLEQDRQKRENNRQYFKEKSRQWRANHPEANAAKSRKYHARKHNAQGTHTVEEVLQMLRDQGYLCCYCEMSLKKRYHVEHLTPLCRGGSNDWTNLGISCPSCNVKKGTKTAEEFMNSQKTTSY